MLRTGHQRIKWYANIAEQKYHISFHELWTQVIVFDFFHEHIHDHGPQLFSIPFSSEVVPTWTAFKRPWMICFSCSARSWPGLKALAGWTGNCNNYEVWREKPYFDPKPQTLRNIHNKSVATYYSSRGLAPMYDMYCDDSHKLAVLLPCAYCKTLWVFWDPWPNSRISLKSV